VEVVRRTEQHLGQVLSKLWIGERTLAWLNRLRINFSPFIPGLKAGEFPAEIVKNLPITLRTAIQLRDFECLPFEKYPAFWKSL
jgi:hypothetical protein